MTLNFHLVRFTIKFEMKVKQSYFVLYEKGTIYAFNTRKNCFKYKTSLIPKSIIQYTRLIRNYENLLDFYNILSQLYELKKKQH